MLTVDELVSLLRQTLNITKVVTVTKDDGSTEDVTIAVTSDKAYLEMTDEDIIMYLKLCASRDYDVDSLEDLPSGAEYPLVLLAQIELLKKLAVSSADWMDIGADNNNYLKRGQRFNHYMTLAEEVQDQYNKYVDTGGTTGGVQTYTVRANNRHMTERDYGLTPTPKVSLKIRDITNDSVDISWSVANTSHFGRYKVFISKSQIIDMYMGDSSSLDSKIVEGATLIKSTSDIRNATHRITGLEAETEYHIAVVSVERNSVWGYVEKTFKTLEAFEDEEDIDIDKIPSGDEENHDYEQNTDSESGAENTEEPSVDEQATETE